MQKYDIHLSAFQIQADTIAALELIGFKRDVFTNSTRCDATTYHATYRGPLCLPDDSLWGELQEILYGDATFIGTLEQESFDTSSTIFLKTESCNRPHPLRTIPTKRAAIGQFKQCDIHINVLLSASTQAAVSYIDSLGLAFFDKPLPDGVHRVFSITGDDYVLGEELHRVLCRLFKEVPNLTAKLKFERTDRYIRTPSDAPTLPIVTSWDASQWLGDPFQRNEVES